jgi:O-antigen ligase
MYVYHLSFFAVVMTRSLFAICIASFIFLISLFVLYGSIKKKFVAIFALIGAASFYFLLKTSFFSDKLLVWKTALAVIRDNFLLGVGFNNYKSVSLSYGILENVDFLYCDDIFLQILAVFLFFVIKKIKLEKDKKLYFFVLIAVTSFMFYNFFNSTSFVSTNMLLFFFLLSFPLPVYGVEKRKKRFNSYILSVLCLPLILVSGVPLYARQEYKKGLSFFASNHFMHAKDCFIEALGSDCLNPEYAGRLSDVYFAIYQRNKNRFLLEKAVEWSDYASRLAKNNGKYFYQTRMVVSFWKK